MDFETFAGVGKVTYAGSVFRMPCCHKVGRNSPSDRHHRTRQAAEKCIRKSDSELELMGSLDGKPDDNTTWYPVLDCMQRFTSGGCEAIMDVED